jgi:hypothetical protein
MKIYTTDNEEKKEIRSTDDWLKPSPMARSIERYTQAIKLDPTNALAERGLKLARDELCV